VNGAVNYQLRLNDRGRVSHETRSRFSHRHTFPNLVPGRTYKVAVRALGNGIDYRRRGPWSDAEDIKLPLPTDTLVPPTKKPKDDDDDDDGGGGNNNGPCKKNSQPHTETRQADGCTQTRTCARWTRVSGKCDTNDSVDCRGSSWSSCPCKETCSSSSRTETKEEIKHDGPVCSLRSYTRTVTVTKCSCPDTTNTSRTDWIEIGRRDCA